MTSKRLRVVAVMTHPVQYLSPWFRQVHAHADALDFTVVYATEPTAVQQGVGFGRAFEWDVPLRDGYASLVVRPSAAGESLDSDRFFGLDVPEVADVVLRLAPDVVLIPGWHSATQVRAIRALRRAGIPVLYRGDTHLGSISRRWPRLSRMRARVMLRQFSGYLAVGTRSREYLRSLDVPDPAIVWSPHAVDNDAFRARADSARRRRSEIRAAFGFSDDQRVVLYAGKLTAIKRPHDVVDAVALLEDGAAMFAGDGAARAAIEAQARAKGVRCVFAGFLNQQQVADAYAAADVLMLPGRETWGLVANEALACGLPVVMSEEVGAAPDLSRAGVATVVAAGQPAAFAAAISSTIERRRCGQSSVADCQAAVERFSFSEATRGLVTAATFAHRNRRPAVAAAPARIIALGGNLVFAGGMERITLEALGAARRGGGDVHALVNGWSSRPIAALAEERDITWQVGHYGARLDGVFRRPLRLMRALGDVVSASTQLTRLLLTRRATHVFAVDFRAVLVHAPALAVCRLLQIPVLLRSGVAPTRTRMHGVLWRALIRPLVSRHVANSRFTANELRAIGIPAERIVTIHNVAPRRHPSSPASTRVPGRIAYVGQIIPAKGVRQLLDAVGLLVAKGHDVTIDIAGEMDGWATADVHAYRSLVRELAARPDLEGRVRFLGWREDIDRVLQQASVHCCPSQEVQREGFGITVVEAKRAGTPSVVCPSGALPELIEHCRDGWIADGFDASAIASGLEWLLADPERLARTQAAASESAQRFDPLAFEQRWQAQFGLLAEQAPPRSAPCELADISGVSR